MNRTQQMSGREGLRLGDWFETKSLTKMETNPMRLSRSEESKP